METLMRVWYLWIYLRILSWFDHVWPVFRWHESLRNEEFKFYFDHSPPKKTSWSHVGKPNTHTGSMYAMVTWIPSINIPLMLAFFYQHHGAMDPMGYWATIATKLPPSICPIPSPTGALSATSNARRDGDGEAGLRVVEEVEGWKAKGCFGDKMSWIQVLYIINLYYIQMIYIVLFYII